MPHASNIKDPEQSYCKACLLPSSAGELSMEDGSKVDMMSDGKGEDIRTTFQELSEDEHDKNENKTDIGSNSQPDTTLPDHEDGVDYNSQLIKEATAAVLNESFQIKRSDSVLSLSDGESVESNESDVSKPPSSTRYMEDVSIEASLLGPNHHCVHPSGWATRPSVQDRETIDLRRNLNSNGSLLPDESVDPGNISPARTDTETSLFRGMSNHFEIKTPPLTSSVTRILDETVMLEDDDDISKLLEKLGLSLPNPKPDNFSDEAIYLHRLFDGFCKPPLDIGSVEGILKMERGESKDAIDLPVDVVIQKSSPVLFQLLGQPLLKLPRYVAMALFRILIRLLTSDIDDEYNYDILVSCPWYEEILPFPSPAELKDPSAMADKSFHRDNEALNIDNMYSIVRFQRNWKAPVVQILSLLESIMEREHYEYLLAPLARLLGLLCTAGVSVQELKRILALATEGKNFPKMQLLLVRALKTAASGASRSSLIAGKASPRSFFSFVSGPGMTRTISSEKWPFRNDFGMALWFRAESFAASSTLLRAIDQDNNGIEVSILPLENNKSKAPVATVLAISILQDGQVIKCIKVRKCILHARVWYHVAIRHRRSGLKGVFTLSSREQLSVILDGKVMLTEALKFPVIQEPLNSLALRFGENFDGQTGSLYVFHDNVSEVTFRALYENTAGTVQKKANVPGEWDSRRGDIVRKSRVLDLKMRQDDVDDIVLSQRVGRKERSSISSVVDLDDEEENSPLSKTAFNSRLYIVWDPRRIESNVALELHGGAHGRIDEQNVMPWTVEGAQDVISSIGGVRALLPVFRSLLSGDIESMWLISRAKEASDFVSLFEKAILCSIIPDLLLMLAAFIRDHHENAREMLRCGGIDIVEQLLHKNKKVGKDKRYLPSSSLVSSMGVFPSLSRLFVKSLLDLHSACSHYVGLETKVFSRLLFNLPLWFGGLEVGIYRFSALLPVLSSITKNNPEKVRDCVGIKDIIFCTRELVEIEVRVP
jgi:hypothetical protein